MLQKHELNWAAWRPTLVLTQQTNYIIAVHIGNHTPWASSLLLFFSSMQTSNHGPKPWIYLLETFCTSHSLHPSLHLVSRQTLEPGAVSESRLVAHHLLAAAFILQESHSPSLLTYMIHICIHHIQVTYTGRPAQRTSHTAHNCSWERLSDLHQLTVLKRLLFISGSANELYAQITESGPTLLLPK